MFSFFSCGIRNKVQYCAFPAESGRFIHQTFIFVYYRIRRRHLNLADAEFRVSVLLPAYSGFEYPQEGERSGASDFSRLEMTQLRLRFRLYLTAYYGCE